MDGNLVFFLSLLTPWLLLLLLILCNPQKRPKKTDKLVIVPMPSTVRENHDVKASRRKKSKKKKRGKEKGVRPDSTQPSEPVSVTSQAPTAPTVPMASDEEEDQDTRDDAESLRCIDPAIPSDQIPEEKLEEVTPREDKWLPEKTPLASVTASETKPETRQERAKSTITAKETKWN